MRQRVLVYMLEQAATGPQASHVVVPVLPGTNTDPGAVAGLASSRQRRTGRGLSAPNGLKIQSRYIHAVSRGPSQLSAAPTRPLQNKYIKKNGDNEEMSRGDTSLHDSCQTKVSRQLTKVRKSPW